jgi:hypothetical protein
MTGLCGILPPPRPTMGRFGIEGQCDASLLFAWRGWLIFNFIWI